MATPSIGTSVSDGYQRGVDRLAATAPSVLVPALIIALTMAVIGEAQTHFGGTLSGTGFDLEVDQSAGDRMIYNLLSLVQGVVVSAVFGPAFAIFAGAMHRARHGESGEVPAPGAMVPAMITTFQALLPRLWILIGLGTLGPLAGIVANGLGALVGFGAFLVSIYFSVKWVYAPVIVGSGEDMGDAAYERSQRTVEGSFWGTFGTLLVIGLATLLPIAIVAGILFALLPTMFVSYFAAGLVFSFAVLTLVAAATESMWAQVEAADVPPPSDAFGTPPAGYGAPVDTPADTQEPPRRASADTDEDSDPYA